MSEMKHQKNDSNKPSQKNIYDTNHLYENPTKNTRVMHGGIPHKLNSQSFLRITVSQNSK